MLRKKIITIELMAIEVLRPGVALPAVFLWTKKVFIQPFPAALPLPIFLSCGRYGSVFLIITA